MGVDHPFIQRAGGREIPLQATPPPDQIAALVIDAPEPMYVLKAVLAQQNTGEVIDVAASLERLEAKLDALETLVREIRAGLVARGSL